MSDFDERPDEDFDWELFPVLDEPSPPRTRAGVWKRRAWFAAVVAVTWLLDASLAVVVACVLAAAGDFRTGRRLARTIPVKAGGRICALFAYAWGAWKVGLMAFCMIYVAMIVALATSSLKRGELPAEFAWAISIWLGGFIASSALTASGFVLAIRSGMRVWIGEGMNEARTLLVSTLLLVFATVVLVPAIVWLSDQTSRFEAPAGNSLFLIKSSLILACLVSGVAILYTVDRIGRRVLAERPGKFGPRVASVGKWNA